MKYSTENTSKVNFTIGERIRTRREELKLSRNEMCKSVEPMLISCGLEPLNEGRLRKWESGENMIHIDYIPFICKKLDCDVGYLFGDYSERKREQAEIGTSTGLSYEAIKWLQAHRYDEDYPDEFSLDTLSTLLTTDGIYDLLYQIQQTAEAINRAQYDMAKCRQHPKNISQEEKYTSVDNLIELEKQISFYRYKISDMFNHVIESMLSFSTYWESLNHIKNSKVFNNYKQYKRKVELEKEFGDLVKEDKNV